jgi:hypothetical protein
MPNGKQKGKRGELELCHVLTELFGWEARRSQQFNGNAGDADLIVKEMPELFVECKRVEALSLPKAMSLAVTQAGTQLPAIFHRRNRDSLGWLLTIRLTDLTRLVEMVSSATAQEQSDRASQRDGTLCLPPGCSESRRQWRTALPSTERTTGQGGCQPDRY